MCFFLFRLFFSCTLDFHCHIFYVSDEVIVPYYPKDLISTVRLWLLLWKQLTCVSDNNSHSWSTASGLAPWHAVVPSINARLGRHAVYEAPAWPAYQLPPHSGSSMCPQAAAAAQLCISTMISSISAADKAGWALIELKLEFDQLTIPIPFTEP